MLQLVSTFSSKDRRKSLARILILKDISPVIPQVTSLLLNEVENRVSVTFSGRGNLTLTPFTLPHLLSCQGGSHARTLLFIRGDGRGTGLTMAGL